jgi:hypothetical protein
MEKEITMATGEQDTADRVKTAQSPADAVDVEQLIRELDAAFYVFPESTLRACQQHRELLTPRLIQVLEETLWLEREGKEREGNAPIFAMMLLGEFETPAALGVLVELLRLPGEVAFELFGDAIHEEVPRILATLAGDQLDVIDSLIADAHANGYVRWAAMSAYNHLVRDGRITRRSAVERLQGHLRAELAKDPNSVDEATVMAITGLVDKLTGLNGNEALTEIEEAFARDWVDDTFRGNFKRVKSYLFPDRPEEFPELDRLGPTKITDTVEELRDWYWPGDPDGEDDNFGDDNFDNPSYEFDEQDFLGPAPLPGAWSPHRLADDLPDESGTVRHEMPRVGRNDPCPCGSGKKYKKCCLRSSAGQ